MMGVVSLLSLGLRVVPAGRLGLYSHFLAGMTVFFCGVAIHLGL